MKSAIIVLICFGGANVSLKASAKEIALSFDDSPRAETSYMSGKERAKLLIENLKKAKVTKAMFFSNTYGLKDEVRKNRLLVYANAGHLIANHTHSHKRPSDLGVQGYIADVLKAESHLKDFPNFVKYFRYPFLDYGKSEDLRDGIKDLLNTHNYKTGYVTVDNGDWYIDSLLQKATRSGKTVNLERLRDAYIYMLWDSIKFYDDLSLKVIRRSPKHVLLLHENDLAALFVGDLVNFIRSKGWKIISPEEAYSDELSQVEPNTLRNNNGRISAIAEAQNFEGPKRDFFQNNKEIEKYFLQQKVFQ